MIESIETINQRLIDYFGKFETNEPNYRVVWSEDVKEKKWFNTSHEGLELLIPELREERKYSYIHNKYVLEKCLPVPGGTIIKPGINELITKTSYEPIWTFEDKFGNALPLIWSAIELLIYTIHKAMADAIHKSPDKQPEIDLETPEAKRERIRIIEEELYGNETSVTDALAFDRAVGYGTRMRNDSKYDKH